METQHSTTPRRLEGALGVVLRGALCNAVATTGARWGTICLEDSLHLHSRTAGREPAAGASTRCRDCSLLQAGYRQRYPRPQEVLPIDGETLPCGSNAVVTLGCESTGTLGVLTLRLAPCRCGTDVASQPGATAARRVSGQLWRFTLARKMETALNRQSLLVGTAESLDPVDEFLARAAQIQLPAVIHGEPGVQKEFIATALHFAGADNPEPFVHLDCHGPDPTPDELRQVVRSAVGGTLFLDGVDDLAPQVQAALSDLLKTEIGIHAEPPAEPAARLVASCRGPLASLAARGEFHPVLQAQLDWLSLAVPPLRQRREDLASLLAYLFLKHGRPELWLSPRAFESLSAYRWPGNAAELERTVARLAVMVEGDLVRQEHLARYVPQIPMAASPVRLGSKRLPLAVVELAGNLVDRQFDRLTGFHPGLRKALRHLAEEGQSRLSLEHLARYACLSPSHLSQVFRSTLGVSFKPFLTLFRVEVARQLLEQDPYASITKVAERAGFGDVSQLERGFKPLVGCTPRAYRRSLRR